MTKCKLIIELGKTLEFIIYYRVTKINFYNFPVLSILTYEQVFDIMNVSLLLERVFYLGDKAMDYKKLIVEMIEKIENHGILEYLYTFISLFLKKWG